MDKIAQSLSKAIREGKWLSITYNQPDGLKFFLIAVTSIIDISRKKLGVKIYNNTQPIRLLPDSSIFFDKIKEAEVLEGTTYEVPESLIDFIESHANEMDWLCFGQNQSNVLNYLIECSKYDKEPYQTQYTLVDGIDVEVLKTSGTYQLSLTQVDIMIKQLKKNAKRTQDYHFLEFHELVINLLSINTLKGLFVIVYRNLLFNPENESLVLGKEVHFNQEFFVTENDRYSLNSYFDEDELNEFKEKYALNPQEYHDRLAQRLKSNEDIDERPYLLELMRSIPVNYEKEFREIMNYDQKQTTPIKAFFGRNSLKNQGRKEGNIVLIDDKVNIDQLRVVHNALKNPVTYVQGPPGTGKTQTILNIVISAIFNNITVLISSNNNKPIDGIYEKIRKLSYKDQIIPIPIIRLGNNEIVNESLEEIRRLYEKYKTQEIFAETLKKQKYVGTQDFLKLNELLSQYEEKQNLENKLEVLEKIREFMKDSIKRTLIDSEINQIKTRLHEIPEMKDTDALDLLKLDNSIIYKWLYYTSIQNIQRLKEPKYADLLKILDQKDDRVKDFNKYLGNDDNLNIFLRVFPVIATTNLSSVRLGTPKPHFDLTIMDEAGQCAINNALLPIIRGERLVLVGDQNQLEPVIVLDPAINNELMKKYNIPAEYNYLNNSILRAMQSIDHISKFILLRFHYRCHKKIIGFSGKKYYDDKLIIETADKYKNDDALGLVPIKGTPNVNKGDRNIVGEEIDAIIKIIRENGYKNCGIITPFRNQADFARSRLQEKGLKDVEIGTIHTFQGDEKDVIFFSTAITSKTPDKAFDWIKNNRELLNVATTRAKEKLIVIGDVEEIKKRSSEKNDLCDLVDYVQTNGTNDIKVNTDELYSNQVKGFKNYNSEYENEFLETITHYLTINEHYIVKEKSRPPAILNEADIKNKNYFMTSEFDFVLLEKRTEKPVLAIELDGLEHSMDPDVQARDRKKEEICRDKNLRLIRILNSYARRYEYIKDAIQRLLKD